MAFIPGAKSALYPATAGSTVRIDNGITIAILAATGLLASVTIVFPVRPKDGDPLSIIAPAGITLVTIQIPAGFSLSGAPPTVAGANSPMRFKFAGVDNTWYPN